MLGWRYCPGNIRKNNDCDFEQREKRTCSFSACVFPSNSHASLFSGSCLTAASKHRTAEGKSPSSSNFLPRWSGSGTSNMGLSSENV